MTHRPEARKLFLAGATGAIGKRLVPLLVKRGWQVFGTTRSADKAKLLAAAGVEPVVLDVFDAQAVMDAVTDARPAVIVHQLTDLPHGGNPAQFAEAVPRNARIRKEGTAHLVAAALAADVPLMVAQSIAWAYAPQARAFREEDPLDVRADGTRGISVGGVAELERRVLQSSPLRGVVLRYGHLYGPGTGAERGSAPPAVHVDAAAWAAVLAIEHGEAGVYNIAEPAEQLDTSKARIKLDWSAAWRAAHSWNRC